MGSDLYMEARAFQPRRPRVQWVGATDILIETDVFYHGWREFYSGPVTPEIQQVMKSMGLALPPKPTPPAFNVTNVKDAGLANILLLMAEAGANTCDCSMREGHDIKPPCRSVSRAKKLHNKWIVTKAVQP